MTEHDLEHAATSEGVPVSPALAPTIDSVRIPVEKSTIDRRTVILCAWSVLLAAASLYGMAHQLFVESGPGETFVTGEQFRRVMQLATGPRKK